MKKPLVMFIGSYWCASIPRNGISEWEDNLARSIDSTGEYDVLTFHFDKYFHTYQQHGDTALIDAINQHKPQYIVCVYHLTVNHPVAGNYGVPAFQTLAAIYHAGIHMIFIWGDLEDKTQRLLSKTIEPLAWKMIGTASKSLTEDLGYKYMHVPKDLKVFNNPKKERDIDVVFSGSYKLWRPERLSAIKYLEENGINILYGGSEGDDHFTTEEYADRYKRAKMALSFSTSTINLETGEKVNVVNARPFEVMSCGAMLLEQKSEELAKLYTPNVDYVEWTDNIDLLKKVKYYLAHEDERLSIAQSGQEKTDRLYNAKTFWEEALK